jgi:excisionase family DNA binding protein
MGASVTDAQAELVHISEVAKQLGLSEYQTRGLVEKGEIAATRIGNRTYIPARAVTEYLESIGRAS